MADNETKIRLTAVDEVTAKLNSIKGAAGDLTASFGKLQGAFAAIGVSAAIGGLVATISSAIKAAASMEELSQKTGIATKELSALDYAMRREGVSTEAFGKAVKELSKNMVEAGDASSKTGRLFKELGVNAQGGTREALLKIADTFKELPDGATKAALAVQVFGKAGLDLIPALNNGAEGIKEIEEQARKLGLTFGNDTGKQAKVFADNMFALTESSKALGYSLAEFALPKLVEITKTMVIAAEEGSKLRAVVIGLREAFSEFVLGEQIASKAADLKARLADLEKLDKEGPGLLERITGLDQSEKIKTKIREIKVELAGLEAFASAKPTARPVTQGGTNTVLEGTVNRLLGGGAGAAAVDTFTKSLDALQNKLDSVSAGFANDFAPSVEILNKALARGNITVERHEDLMAKLVKQQPSYKAGLEAEAKLHDSVTKSLADGVAERRRYVDSIRDEIDRQRYSNETLGMTREQIAAITVLRLEERLAILQASGAMEDELEALAEEIRLRKELAGEISNGERGRENIQRTSQDLQAQVGIWSSLGDVAGDFFADLVINGKSAFDNLREWAKRFLADLISIFAKKFFLNIVAGSGGTFSVAASAASTASEYGSYLSGASTLASGASIIGTGIGQTGIAQFYGGITGAIQGPGLTGAAGAGSALAPYLGVIGIAAAVVAGMLIADGQFSRGWRIDNNRDGGGVGAIFDRGSSGIPGALWMANRMDDTMRAFGFNDRWAAILSGSSLAARIFGRRARQNDAFGIMGDLGQDGVTGQNWQDWSEQGGWFSSTRRGTDVSPFSPEQLEFFKKITDGIGAVVGEVGRLVGADPAAILAGYSKPFNFQLNENGEPLSEEAIAKLFGDFFGTALQEQVAMLLEGGGKDDLAKYVKALTGTGDEISAKVLELVGLMQVLEKVDILGLTTEDLIKWQREGETLSETFNKIAESWGQYQDLFLTDGEKISLAQKQLAAGFAELGIAVPTSNEAFRKLVEGLDLSTEEGRKLFEGLMALAPGFAAVQNAAAGLLASFDQIASRRNPALGRSILESDLKTAVEAFMARNPWTSGMDWREVARQINLITSDEDTRADFQRYSPEDRALILSILGITDTLNGLGDAASNASDALGSVGTNVAAAIDSWRDIKGDLWSFLRGLYTDPEFSPLDPAQQLDTLKSRFVSTLERARAGQIQAGLDLPGLIEQILRAGRENFASGAGYSTLFDWVTGLAGDFVQPGGGMELQRLAYEEQRRHTEILGEVRTLLAAIFANGTAGDAEVAASVTTAALATARK